MRRSERRGIGEVEGEVFDKEEEEEGRRYPKRPEFNIYSSIDPSDAVESELAELDREDCEERERVSEDEAGEKEEDEERDLASEVV